MSTYTGSTAVIFLTWWRDQEGVRRFMDSYRRHPAGIDHKLYVLPKEFPHIYFPELMDGREATWLPNLPGTVMDLPAYFHAAEQVKEDVVCFLNTRSEILADGWLAKLRAALDLTGVDAAGATGNWERLAEPDWPPYPNVHLRTNAFIMRRRVFLMLPRRPGNTVADCCRWESGPDNQGGVTGLTHHLLRMNSRSVVVGANGQVYEWSEWPRSGTFRQSEQENLLVGDRQSRVYRDADPVDRTHLRMLSWQGAAAA